MSFYGAETWYINLNKNILKTFMYRIIKLSNVCVEETYDSNHECLEQVYLPISSIFWLRNKTTLASDYSILEAHT